MSDQTPLNRFRVDPETFEILRENASYACLNSDELRAVSKQIIENAQDGIASSVALMEKLDNVLVGHDGDRK